MSELFSFVFHPSRWGAIDGLPEFQRLLLSLIVLGLTVVIAAAAGVLSAKWARARSQRAGAQGPVEERIRRVRRGLVMLLWFVGLYLALQVAPLPAHLDGVLSGITFVLGALVTARLLIHLVTLLLTTSVAHVSGDERARFEREYVPLTTKVTTLAVALILVVVVAKHFGRDVSSLLAALGVGSLAIGLAAQQTLGNMIAGFVLLVDRPFRPGDRIKLASGEAGEVLDVGVRSTRILLGDNNLLIVPNTELANSRVVNFGYPSPAVHGEVRVTVAFGADLERASQILLAIAGEEDRIAKQPAPTVRVVALALTGVELQLGYVAASLADAPAIEDRLRRALLARFASARLELARAPAVAS
jgi:small-conductance mechanosensitive channel